MDRRINEFSDLNEQEFKKNYLNLDLDIKEKLNDEPQNEILENDRQKSENDIPKSWDWTKKGVLNPIENQGQCGASWAFVALSHIESLYYIKKNKHIKLSEQMLIDCDKLNYGCKESYPHEAFHWIKLNGGIITKSSYPYRGREGICQMDRSRFVKDLKVVGYKQLSQDEETIKEELYRVGPLVAIMNDTPLHSYKSGIIDLPESECPTEGINRSVFIVGYGHDTVTKKDYWIVRNTVGTTWGEDGSFRIVRGKNCCGINELVTYAILNSDE